MKQFWVPLLLAGQIAAADAPVVRDVTATKSQAGWRFDVTIAHADTGWDHYADGWRVEDASGAVLGLRVLGHPHVAEQPFTRSLSGVVLPNGTTSVFIRSRCNTDGWSQQVFEVITKSHGL